jgi:hypothetical protein
MLTTQKAAAVRGNAEVIVTFNVRDFPEPALKPYDILAVHPNDFLLDQLDLYPASPSTSSNNRQPPTDANPPPSPDCYPYSNALAYPDSRPKSAVTSGSTPIIGPVLRQAL